MEIELNRWQGQNAQVMAQVRCCRPADFEEMFALQSRVRSEMPHPDWFVPDTAQEMQSDLQHSLCIGVWAGQALAGCVVLRYCGEGEHNYARLIGVPKSDWKYWANGNSAMVAPEWRGNRLQQRLTELAFAWRRPDIIGVACTVCPENTFSLANVQAGGFSVVARREMYGGHDRYLLVKKLEPLPGKYRHFKGNEYEVLGTAVHSETRERMVVYRALYGEHGTWVRPAAMWFEHIDRDEYHGPRFVAACADMGEKAE